MKRYKWFPEVEPIKQGIKVNIIPKKIVKGGCGCKSKQDKLEEEIAKIEEDSKKKPTKQNK